MTRLLAQITAWLNAVMNGLGRGLLAPLIGAVPGWLSNTVVAAVTGVLLLVIFKYTSNQGAIGRVRDSIKANMLALKLFKDSMAVTVQSQGRLFKAALLLLVHAIRPMAVMIVPISLLVLQLMLWYEARPLRPGESAVVVMEINGEIGAPWPEVILEVTPAADVNIGPVRVLSNRQICWEIQARQNGKQPLVFQVDQQKIEKELAIGEGFVPVSVERPGWRWSSMMRHPRERPFAPDSVVQSIAIDYPDRSSTIIGIPWWLVYFFVASMVFALIFKPFLKVKI